MPFCAKCNEELTSDYIDALDCGWHRKCFVCAICNLEFQEGGFVVHDNKAIHEACYQQVRERVVCPACGEEVSPGQHYLAALDKGWHSECFKCCICKEAFEDSKFFAKDGKPAHAACLLGEGKSQKEDAVATPSAAAATTTTTTAAVEPVASDKTKSNGGKIRTIPPEPEPESERVNLRHVELKKSGQPGQSADCGGSSGGNGNVSGSGSSEDKSKNKTDRVIEFYSYEELKMPGSKLTIKEIDLTKRELHLNDTDFETIFGMKRGDFVLMPQWKRDNLKKSKQLF